MRCNLIDMVYTMIQEHCAAVQPWKEKAVLFLKILAPRFNLEAFELLTDIAWLCSTRGSQRKVAYRCTPLFTTLPPHHQYFGHIPRGYAYQDIQEKVAMLTYLPVFAHQNIFNLAYELFAWQNAGFPFQEQVWVPSLQLHQ